MSKSQSDTQLSRDTCRSITIPFRVTIPVKEDAIEAEERAPRVKVLERLIGKTLGRIEEAVEETAKTLVKNLNPFVEDLTGSNRENEKEWKHRAC